MKKIFILAFAFLSFAAYSQINIPASSSRGTILTQTNQKIDYSNLKYEKGKVSYTNLQNGQQEFLYDNSVKSIEEKNDVVTSSKIESQNSAPSAIISQKVKLTDRKEIKKFLLEENNLQYKKGKSQNNAGTVILVGGAACFGIGGIINISKSNQINTNNKEISDGTPIPLIIGGLGILTGVVMKISGHSQMKKAIENYQNSDARKFTPSYYVLNNQNGVGFMMKF